jgi:hypothetical protein
MFVEVARTWVSGCTTLDVGEEEPCPYSRTRLSLESLHMKVKLPKPCRVDWASHNWGPKATAVAPHVLPILLKRAREGRTITYSELATAVYKRDSRFVPTYRKTFYGAPVGLVGHVLEDLGRRRRERIPPLNVLVINKRTGLPGIGADNIVSYFFRGTGKKFSERDRRDMMRQATEAVFDYGERWLSVAEDLCVDVLRPATGQLHGRKQLMLPKLAPSQRGESKQHRSLKAWVRTHPVLFNNFGTFDSGVNEYLISSGDRLDVHFDNGRQRLAVEVKPSQASADELGRGVFQVVKYRAVMRAEQICREHVPNAQAVLVSVNRPDPNTRELLKRLHVVHIPAPAHAEEA